MYMTAVENPLAKKSKGSSYYDFVHFDVRHRVQTHVFVLKMESRKVREGSRNVNGKLETVQKPYSIQSHNPGRSAKVPGREMGR
jgi:hypothetical protein